MPMIAIKKRRWILLSIAVLLLLAACVFTINYMPTRAVRNSMVIEAVIESVSMPRDYPESFASLAIVEEGAQKLIFVNRDTKFYDGRRARISAFDLTGGQRIRATVGKSVFYEPVETYFECHEIVVLEP
jgi:hypothetical protein